jgi:hypothetical protein
MSQAYETYIKAINACRESEQNVEQLIARLNAFAAPLLKNWRQCYIDMSGRTDDTAALFSKERVDGSNVPSAHEIRSAIEAHSKAMVAAQRAWTAVPEEERRNVLAPSWIKRGR